MLSSLPLILLLSSFSQADSQPAIGDQVVHFSFVGPRYVPRTTRELPERDAYVFAFLSVDCPISNRYLPRLVEMDRVFAPRNVQFVAINVGAEDSIQEVATQAVESGAAFPFVKDFDGQAARTLGVERTPEVVVLDADRRLQYRGRIDDQIRFGGRRPTIGRADLERAIEEVLAGEEVSVPETPVDGCLITPPVLPRIEPVTYAEHVAPIIERRCLPCHRKDGIAPFALERCEQVSSKRRMIAEVVRQGRMPPWFASPAYGEFANDPTLTGEERATISSWADQGMCSGDPATISEPDDRQAASSWRGGTPDLIVTPERQAQLPADGVIPYRYEPLPYVFERETWVREFEIRPSNPRVVHHINLFHYNPSNPRDRSAAVIPGGEPIDPGPGAAHRIPAGSVLGLQTHYVTTGAAETNLTSIGMRFPRTPVRAVFRSFTIDERDFEIPARSRRFEVTGSVTMPADVTAVGFFPHMHLRGKDVRIEAVYPTGAGEDLLLVPNYNFDWQLPYLYGPDTKLFPKGTVIRMTGHFDNSGFNPYNPAADKAVRWGLRSTDEMFLGSIFAVKELDVAIHVDPRTGHALPPSATH